MTENKRKPRPKKKQGEAKVSTGAWWKSDAQEDLVQGSEFDSIVENIEMSVPAAANV